MKIYNSRWEKIWTELEPGIGIGSGRDGIELKIKNVSQNTSFLLFPHPRLKTENERIKYQPFGFHNLFVFISIYLFFVCLPITIRIFLLEN